MMPGGRMNPRQAQAMMRRMGMAMEPVDGVEEVVIRTKDGEQVFRNPEVTIVTVQGTRTYQIVGKPEMRKRGDSGSAAEPPAPAATAGPAEEDVELVMSQTGVERDAAIHALGEAGGAPAEAILALLARKDVARR